MNNRECMGLLGVLLLFSLNFSPIFAISDLERVTMSNSLLKNAFGAPIIDNINTHQQIQISSDIENNEEKPQDFVYFVQIKNKEGIVVSLGWISGQIASEHMFNPSLSWTPNNAGEYIAEIFVWESLKNTTPLDDSSTVQIHVS